MEKNKVMDFVLELREAKALCEKAEMAILNLKNAADAAHELIPILLVELEQDGLTLPDHIEERFDLLETAIRKAQIQTYDSAVHAQDDYIAVLEEMLTASMGVTFDFDEDGKVRVMLQK